MKQEYMRINEILNYCKISRGTLYNWFKKGLKFYKNSGIVFVKKEDVDRFIMKGE